MPALDGLRALAALSVITFHTRSAVDGGSSISHAYAWLAVAGWSGVDLFFVLSGFLITGILLDAKDHPHYFRNFYMRRVLRIFPLYYAVLVFMLLVAPHLFGADDPGVQRILDHQAYLWTYTTNFAVVHGGSEFFTGGWMWLTHLWSLAVEEQFYLVWPLLVFVLPRRWLVGAAAAIVVAAPILRHVLISGGMSGEAIYQLTPCRLDTLAIGALIAVLVRARPEWTDRVIRGLALAGALGVAGALVIAHRLDSEDPAVQVIGFSALALGFAAIVLRASRGVRWLEHPVLMRLGRYSYGIYIFHALMLPGLRAHWKPPANAGGALAFTFVIVAASTALAAFSWHVFERRFLALKDRFTS